MPDTAKVTAPLGALSVEIGGERYPVKDGHVVVRDPFYASEVLRVADAIRGDLVTFRGSEGDYCPKCRRTAWPWESRCPCGA